MTLTITPIKIVSLQITHHKSLATVLPRFNNQAASVALPGTSAIPIKHGVIYQARYDRGISAKVGGRTDGLYLFLVITKGLLKLVAVKAEAVRQSGGYRANY